MSERRELVEKLRKALEDCCKAFDYEELRENELALELGVNFAEALSEAHLDCVRKIVERFCKEHRFIDLTDECPHEGEASQYASGDGFYHNAWSMCLAVIYDPIDNKAYDIEAGGKSGYVHGRSYERTEVVEVNAVELDEKARELAYRVGYLADREAKEELACLVDEKLFEDC